MLFAAVHESVCGTFETCRPTKRMSACRGRPEVNGARSDTTRMTHLGSQPMRIARSGCKEHRPGKFCEKFKTFTVYHMTSSFGAVRR